MTVDGFVLVFPKETFVGTVGLIVYRKFIYTGSSDIRRCPGIDSVMVYRAAQSQGGVYRGEGDRCMGKCLVYGPWWLDNEVRVSSPTARTACGDGWSC